LKVRSKLTQALKFPYAAVLLHLLNFCNNTESSRWTDALWESVLLQPVVRGFLTVMSALSPRLG